MFAYPRTGTVTVDGDPYPWTVEGPDESVGIFGFAVYHECPFDVEPPYIYEDDDDIPELALYDAAEGTYTCKQCAAVLPEEPDTDPNWEE